MVTNLIRGYAEYRSIELKEYSNRKKIYYTEQTFFDDKLKDVVFDRDMAIDNESYDYINITHPLTKKVLHEILFNESLTFNIEMSNFSSIADGILFLYRIELTNNQGFVRRHIIPVFVDDNINYQEKVSKLFDNVDKYTIRTGMKSLPEGVAEKAYEKSTNEISDRVKLLFTLNLSKSVAVQSDQTV